MRLDKVTLSEVELSKIDPAFASTRPGFTKRATVIFTNGKSDPFWRGGSPNDEGITYPWAVGVDESSRKCGGFCLVDIFRIMIKNRENNKGFVKRGFKYTIEPTSLRHGVLIATVHELFHINQGWMFGKSFVKEFDDEFISAEARYEDFAAVNPDMAPSAYMQNIFEMGAFDFVSRWWEANAADINKGIYDFLLPMTTMKGIFPDRPDAYR